MTADEVFRAWRKRRSDNAHPYRLGHPREDELQRLAREAYAAGLRDAEKAALGAVDYSDAIKRIRALESEEA